MKLNTVCSAEMYSFLKFSDFESTVMLAAQTTLEFCRSNISYFQHLGYKHFTISLSDKLFIGYNE